MGNDAVIRLCIVNPLCAKILYIILIYESIVFLNFSKLCYKASNQ